MPPRRRAGAGDGPRDLASVAASTPEDMAACWKDIALHTPEARAPLNSSISVAIPSAAVLGECPLWSERRRLLWVDTQGRTLNQFDPATGRHEAHPIADDPLFHSLGGVAATA